MNLHDKQCLGKVIVDLLQGECDTIESAMDILLAVLLQAAVEANVPQSKVIQLVKQNYELAVDINLQEDALLGITNVGEAVLQ